MKKKREHYVTCGQMKILEKRADEDGLSYYQMMENAGRGAAEFIMEKAGYSKTLRNAREFYGSSSPGVAEIAVFTWMKTTPRMDINDEIFVSKRVFIFCGKGNNGGDGFVAARIMAGAGYEVTVILVDGPPVTPDSIRNLELLKAEHITVADMESDKTALMRLKGRPGIIVDAVYGTGFRGELTGNGLKAAIYINHFSDEEHPENRPVVFALDIPSGMGGDLTKEKKLDTNCVKANYTLTFHARKPVHLQRFAAEYCGEIIVVDIGIDEERLWNVEY